MTQVFAGPIKPKPFERKRANLTALKQGKMPALPGMRKYALSRKKHHISAVPLHCHLTLGTLSGHLGPERPVPTDSSNRMKYALDHIHTGGVMFAILAATGPGISGELQNAKLILDDDRLIISIDVAGEMGSAVACGTTKRLFIPFADIKQHTIVDTATSADKNGISFICNSGTFSIAVGDINYLSKSFDHYFNNFLFSRGEQAMPGTTHGRRVMGIHTLLGEVNELAW